MERATRLKCLCIHLATCVRKRRESWPSCLEVTSFAHSRSIHMHNGLRKQTLVQFGKLVSCSILSYWSFWLVSKVRFRFILHFSESENTELRLNRCWDYCSRFDKGKLICIKCMFIHFIHAELREPIKSQHAVKSILIGPCTDERFTVLSLEMQDLIRWTTFFTLLTNEKDKQKPACSLLFVALLFSASSCCRIFAGLCTRWDRDLCSLYSDLQGPRQFLSHFKMVSSLSDQTPRFLTLFYDLIRFSREPGKISNFLWSRHVLKRLGPFFPDCRSEANRSLRDGPWRCQGQVGG